MASVGTTNRKRAFGVGAFIAACIGCCSIPFLAGLTIFGVAVCSTKFLGVAAGAVLAIAAFAAYAAYRRRTTCNCESGSCRVPAHNH